MSFLKIGKMIVDMASVDLIDLFHIPDTLGQSQQEPLPVVRLQLKNRRDDLVTVAGMPRHIKHGVVDLPAELSEKFRWFVEEIGPQLGILDVEKAYKEKDAIAVAKQQIMQQKLAQQENPQEKSGKPFLVPKKDPVPSLRDIDAFDENGDPRYER